MDRLKRQPYRIERGIKIFHDKILKVGGDKLRARKSKVDHIKEQANSYNNGRVTESRVAKLKMEKDLRILF